MQIESVEKKMSSEPSVDKERTTEQDELGQPADAVIPAPPLAVAGKRNMDSNKSNGDEDRKRALKAEGKGNSPINRPGAYSVASNSEPSVATSPAARKARRQGNRKDNTAVSGNDDESLKSPAARKEKAFEKKKADRAVPGKDDESLNSPAARKAKRFEKNKVKNGAVPANDDVSLNLTAARKEKRFEKTKEAPPRVSVDDEGDQNLVEAELAEEIDVEALVNERLEKITVGIPSAEVKEEDDEEESGQSRMKYLCGLVVVAGAVVAAVVSLKPSDDGNPVANATFAPTPTPIPSQSPTQAPTTVRFQKVETILADYAPLSEQALSWLGDTDTWEPVEGDPNSGYLWLERYVMADLYFSLGGPNWIRTDNWLSAEPVCNWYLGEESINPCPGPVKELNLGKYRISSLLP